jgi:concanavalin A-like lectin/glucanase superfamily protein
MRALVATLVAAGAAGCYDPNYGNGELACTAAGECPSGYVCRASDMRCYQALGAGPDGGPPGPQVIIQSPSGGSVTGQQVITNFVAVSNSNVSFECRFDNGSFAACASGQTFTLPPGMHTLYVHSRTVTGGLGPDASVTWTVSPNGATVTITGPPDNLSFSKFSMATFSFSITPSDGVTLTCKRDGVTLSRCESPLSFTGLGDGAHQLVVEAVRMGVMTSSSLSWTVDTMAPVAGSFSGQPTDGALVNKAAVLFTFAATDANPITYMCNRDGQGFLPCTSPESYSTTTEGAHSFAVQAVDPAGNFTPLGARSWTTDTLPPDTMISASNLGATNQTTVTVTPTSTEAGSTLACTFDAASVPCSDGTPLTRSGLAVGSHTFTAAATDRAGNPDGSPAQFTFAVTNAPLVFYRFENNYDSIGALGNTSTYAAVATGTPTFVAGKFGSAVSFPNSPTTYLTLPLLNEFHSGSAFTVSLWFNETSLVNPATLWTFQGSAGNRLESYHGASGPNLFTCVVNIACANFAYSMGTWHNLLYRYAGTGQGVDVYLDDVLMFTLTGPTGNLFNAASSNPIIGQSTVFMVDEIQVYDQVYGRDVQCTNILHGSFNAQTGACILP